MQCNAMRLSKSGRCGGNCVGDPEISEMKLNHDYSIAKVSYGIWELVLRSVVYFSFSYFIRASWFLE